MTDLEQGDVLQRIRWALRTHTWVVGVVILATIALAWYAASAASDAGQYQATALVVANTLEVPPEQLARSAAAVFTSGAVAEGVAADLSLDVDPRELVPTHIAMDPVAESIALLVHGFSDEAQRSVELANAAADNFVRELNAAGPGVGTFSVQDPARAPGERVTWPGREVALAAAGVTGMLLALVVLAAIGWLRRPLLTAGDVRASLGLPLLATVSVGRAGAGSRDTVVTSHPLVVRTLAQHLLATRHPGFVLVGEAQTQDDRRALVLPLAEELLLQASGASAAPRRWAHGSSQALDEPRIEAPSVAARGPRHVVVLEDWDADRAPASSWGVVVVAEQGAPARGLSQLVEEWRSDAVGVLMLRR